jgi:hypothetical protein
MKQHNIHTVLIKRRWRLFRRKNRKRIVRTSPLANYLVVYNRPRVYLKQQ